MTPDEIAGGAGAKGPLSRRAVRPMLLNQPGLSVIDWLEQPLARRYVNRYYIRCQPLGPVPLRRAPRLIFIARPDVLGAPEARSLQPVRSTTMEGPRATMRFASLFVRERLGFCVPSW